MKERLFQLQVMSLACIYIRKQNYLPHRMHNSFIKPESVLFLNKNVQKIWTLKFGYSKKSCLTTWNSGIIPQGFAKHSLGLVSAFPHLRAVPITSSITFLKSPTDIHQNKFNWVLLTQGFSNSQESTIDFILVHSLKNAASFQWLAWGCKYPIKYRCGKPTDTELYVASYWWWPNVVKLCTYQIMQAITWDILW